MAQKKKYLAINLTKNIQTYDNYKMLVKEINDLNK